jgi:hypothetical protein
LWVVGGGWCLVEATGGIEIDIVLVAVPSSIKVSISVDTLMLDVEATTTQIPTSTKSIGF